MPCFPGRSHQRKSSRAGAHPAATCAGGAKCAGLDKAEAGKQAVIRYKNAKRLKPEGV